MSDTINDKQSTEDAGAVGKPAVSLRSFSSEEELTEWVQSHIPILIPPNKKDGRLVYPFKSSRCQTYVADIIAQELWSYLNGD